MHWLWLFLLTGASPCGADQLEAMQRAIDELRHDVTTLSEQNTELRHDMTTLSEYNTLLAREVTALREQVLTGSNEARTGRTYGHGSGQAVAVEGDSGQARTAEEEEEERRRRLTSSSSTTASILYDGTKVQINKDVEIGGRLVVNETVRVRNTVAWLTYLTETYTASGVILWDTEEYDVGGPANGNYDPSTGGFTAPVSGLYLLYATARHNDGNRVTLNFYVNGNEMAPGSVAWDIQNGQSSLTYPLFLKASDVLEVRNEYSGGIATEYSGRYSSFFGGVLLTAIGG